MPSPKYPLQPLLDHRERAVDDRTAELGGAVRARENADAARARAAASQDAAEGEAAAVRRREADLLADGALRVADLARGQAWEIGAQATIAELARATAVAAEALSASEQAERQARGQLAKAMADRDVVAKDQARFEDRQKKKQIASEEEQAEDVHRGGKS